MAKNSSGEDESDLNRMALEEILKETKRGKERAEAMGPMGWVKCPLVSTNKRFFRNVLMGTLANQRRKNRMKDSQRKLQISSKEHGKFTPQSSSSSSGSSQEKNIVGKTGDKFEQTGESYSPSKNSDDKHKGTSKNKDTQNVTEKGSYHSRRYNDDETHKKSRKHKIKEHKKEHKYHEHKKRRK